MDLSINKSFKDHMKMAFQMWYAQQVCLQLQYEQVHKPVDLRPAVVKPLSAHWIMAAFTNVKGKPDLVKNGFHEAGITAALK